jgi:hypothetical protein
MGSRGDFFTPQAGGAAAAIRTGFGRKAPTAVTQKTAQRED